MKKCHSILIVTFYMQYKLVYVQEGSFLEDFGRKWFKPP